jgi:hypothetical protein
VVEEVARATLAAIARRGRVDRVRAIEEDAVQVLVALEDRGEHLPLPAADIHHASPRAKSYDSASFARRCR